MPRINVPVIDPKAKYKGVQATGGAWSPGLTSLNLTGFSTGDIGASGIVETYLDGSAYGDGQSDPLSRVGKTIKPWRLRNFFRHHAEAVMEILTGFEGLLLDDLGGDVVTIARPDWLDQPLETDPEEAETGPPQEG